MAAMLTFWLRELAMFRPKKADPKWGCLKKAVFAGQGLNSCAVCYIVFFFVALVIDFMILNLLHYMHVRGDPSLEGKYDFHTEHDLNDKFLWPLLATIVLLIIYYTQYALALGMGCIKWASDPKMSKARKVGFLTGIVVHFFFVFCILFGVFNRHFRNGGVQLLSFGVVNFYVYLLVILHWPVRTIIKDSNINDSEIVGLADKEVANEALARRDE